MRVAHLAARKFEVWGSIPGCTCGLPVGAAAWDARVANKQKIRRRASDANDATHKSLARFSKRCRPRPRRRKSLKNAQDLHLSCHWPALQAVPDRNERVGVRV